MQYQVNTLSLHQVCMEFALSYNSTPQSDFEHYACPMTQTKFWIKLQTRTYDDDDILLNSQSTVSHRKLSSAVLNCSQLFTGST